MAMQPMPAPPLDGNPPSPPGLGAGGQSPSLSQLSPGAQLSGSMQMVQMSLEAVAQAAKLLDMVGQINPAFAPIAQMLIEQMKNGLRSTLQQGSQGSELAGPSPQQGMMPMGSPIPGATQTPPPALPSGLMGQ